MPTSRLALKLTNSRGRTANGPTYAGIKLSVGQSIKRRKKGCITACNAAAVHAYRNLEQAIRNDRFHCSHGLRGILWLVRLYSPRQTKLPHWQRRTLPFNRPLDEKLIGTSYTVLRRLGPMGAVDRVTVKKALRGEQ